MCNGEGMFDWWAVFLQSVEEEVAQGTLENVGIVLIVHCKGVLTVRSADKSNRLSESMTK